MQKQLFTAAMPDKQVILGATFATFTISEWKMSVPANDRQRFARAAETDGCVAELFLLSRAARSVNTSSQHAQTTSRISVSKEVKTESQSLTTEPQSHI